VPAAFDADEQSDGEGKPQALKEFYCFHAVIAPAIGGAPTSA
jgi:hypothetical protein